MTATTEGGCDVLPKGFRNATGGTANHSIGVSVGPAASSRNAKIRKLHDLEVLRHRVGGRAVRHLSGVDAAVLRAGPRAGRESADRCTSSSACRGHPGRGV